MPFSLNDFYQTKWSNLPWEAWVSIFYSGIFPLFLGNILWIWGAGVIGSNKASLYNNLPRFSVLLGCLFLRKIWFAKFIRSKLNYCWTDY